MARILLKPLNTAQKTSYILLILWLGVISPLVYYGGLSPHQGVESYHFSFLETSSQSEKLQQILPQISTRLQPEWQTFRLRARAYFSGVTFVVAAGQVHFSALDTSCFLESMPSPLAGITLHSGPVFVGSISQKSICLPPLERPPSPV